MSLASQDSVRRAIEKLKAEIKQTNKSGVKVDAAPIKLAEKNKKETLVFEMNDMYSYLLTVNAVFSCAAFPVHAWGYSLHVEPLLLIFPFSFSVLWFFYSWKKANRTIRSVKLLAGHQEVELTPYSFWGTSMKPIIVDKSKFNVILDAPKTDRAKRNQVDIQGSFHGTKIKTNTRFIIERWKGKVLDRTLFRHLFVFDSDSEN